MRKRSTFTIIGLLGVALMFMQCSKKDTDSISSVGTKGEEAKETIYSIVEVMPTFEGGEEAMFEYLNRNIRYPVVAQENGIQGRVVCGFVVRKDGSITNIEVLRGVDPSLDKEAIRVIQSMPKWIPGKNRGADVSVNYRMPVTFRLMGDHPEVYLESPAATASIKMSKDEVLQVVDDMPMFKGGETALFKFLNENIKYPAIAEENGIDGRVTCQFVVKSDGSISDVEVLRGVEPSLDREAMRVIQSMPNWIPGKKDGEAVNVSYRIPVTFRLN